MVDEDGKIRTRQNSENAIRDQTSIICSKQQQHHLQQAAAAAVAFISSGSSKTRQWRNPFRPSLKSSMIREIYFSVSN
jgi:hypothetical protein